MNPRIKKIIGSLALLAFMALYVAGAIVLADKLPKHPAVDLVYFVVAGVAWVLPIIPLMIWMNREPKA